jgi:hypothetical protein
MLENVEASVKGGRLWAALQCARMIDPGPDPPGPAPTESTLAAKKAHVPAILLLAATLPFVGGALAETAEPAPEAAVRAAPAGVTKIQGRAYEGRRRPVVGAAVTVRDEGDAGLLVMTATDERGQLKVKDVPDGLYLVTFRKAGYGTVRKDRIQVKSPLRPVIEVPMAVSPESAVEVEPEGPTIDPVPTDVRGQVVDVAGAAVPDVRLRFVRTDGRFDPHAVRTGPEGRFSIAGVEAGAWDTEVYGVGFLPIRAPVIVDRDLTVTVRLVPQPTDFEASPLDLMPIEVPVAPPGLATAAAAVEPDTLR